jgi:hypothetical protein
MVASYQVPDLNVFVFPGNRKLVTGNKRNRNEAITGYNSC